MFKKAMVFVLALALIAATMLPMAAVAEGVTLELWTCFTEEADTEKFLTTAVGGNGPDDIWGLFRFPSAGGEGSHFKRYHWQHASTAAPSTQVKRAVEDMPVAVLTQMPAPKRPVMRAYRDEEYMYVFGSQYMREEIYTISFEDSLANIPANADVWDISEAGDGSVLAWVTPTNYGLYDLTIAGDGGVTAPVDCSYLFACYYYAAEISFNHCFDTSGVTNMAYMFWNVSTDALAPRPYMNLDLSSFDTSNVTNMHSMFMGCGAENIDISSFNMSKVTDTENMFG